MKVVELAAALVDLVLPGACAGCGGGCPGALCAGCRDLLSGPPRRAVPNPCPPAFPRCWTVAAYAGPVAALVSAHKDRGRLALAAPLGMVLARALGAVLDVSGGGPWAGSSVGRRVLVVPVPSRGAVVRARGHDATVRMTRRALADLRRRGHSVACVPVLRHARRVSDQAGLGAAERGRNLSGALCVPARLAGLVRGLDVVVVDDVVTTGATLAEAARALRVAGARVLGAATVAATARRRPGRISEGTELVRSITGPAGMGLA